MENNNNERFSPIKSLLGLLSFSTIIPVKQYTSIEYMTRLVWCWPFIHLIIGILAAVCGIICADVLHLNPFFTSVIIYAFLMLITGYNHLDGVMDMADGVMVQGDPQRKISVMKDSSVGAGGVATLFLVAVLTIAGIYSVLDYECIAGIIICEMVAKSSLLTTSLLSTPSNNGIGCYFIYSTNIFNYILSTVIVAVIAYLVGDIIGIIGLVGAVVAGALIAFIAKRNFIIANGDVLVMSNEVGRLMALLFMSVALFFL